MKKIEKNVWYKATRKLSEGGHLRINHAIWCYLAENAPDMEFKATSISDYNSGGLRKVLTIQTRDGVKHTTKRIASTTFHEMTHIFNDHDVECGNIIKVKEPKMEPSILTDAHAEERSFLLQQVIALRTALEKTEERLAKLPQV
ncbi:hypothetical protein CPT_Muldoon_066 [Serratia phage Muldoon]|uniref:Uncharacterized protein n=1 Tax=Serratia phage Muldoon TaxID=2601678 RepID=A0A5P8PH42_9CAUD|nr:hypothetical protein HYP94_gp065 [Serratia phage Muldoon]QFR56022.1 hypothetical protein CPT_Muldoon_066 [Serratia phage Muldoon]